MTPGMVVGFVRMMDRAMYWRGLVLETNASGVVLDVTGFGRMFFYHDEVTA